MIRLFHGSKNGINGTIQPISREFCDGEITDIALVESLSALKLGIQYVAKTQKACDAISVLNKYQLSSEQRKELITRSEENRQLGISLANKICREHRREGKYFDELIK